MLNEFRGAKEEGKKTSDIYRTLKYGSIINITTEEVGEALRKMGRTKAVEPDNISI